MHLITYMRIYISARNMYQEETEKVARFLEKHGHVVYYSAKNTYQKAPIDEMFLNNLVLIRNSDVFIAYLTKKNYFDIDTAVEVGIAVEAGKPVFGYLDIDVENQKQFHKLFEKDIMIQGSFSKIFTNIEEFANFLLTI